MRYDRARHSLDRHATYTVSTFVAGASRQPPTFYRLTRYVDDRGSRDLGECTQARDPRRDMLHAYRNPIRVFDLDDLTMLVGPDQAAQPLEIGVARGDGIEFIMLAMAARDKF